MTSRTAVTGPGLDWLVERVAERTGLDFTGSHHGRMVQVLRRMCRDSGARSYAEYASRLEDSEEAYAALIDRLTVGETYFFREPAHFQLLREQIVPDHVAAGGDRPLRVWSAGCATGEEAYSVAIALVQSGVLGRSQILGTDLSTQALDRARAAVYGGWSLRRCGEDQRRAWFRSEGRQFRLNDRYREAVEWRERNLLDGPPAGRFDVVLCRNVLIYLTPTGVGAAARSLHDALAPGGWLLLGASDPGLEHAGLQRVPGRRAAVYRRSDAPPRRRRAAARLPDAAGLPQSRQPDLGPAEGAGAIAVPAPPRLAEVSATPKAKPEEHGSAAAAIRALGGRGDLHLAHQAVAAAVAADPVDAELRYLEATVHLHAGRSDDAARAAAAAIYLDPGLVVGHLVLAQAEREAGRHQRARRSYRNALDLLASMPPDAELPLADGELAGAVAAVIIGELERDPGSAAS